MGQDIRTSYNGVNYSINKKVELISVIMLLSNYYRKYPFLKTSFPNTYIDEINTHFFEFKKHPAILKLDMLAEHDFCFDIPFMTILSCNNESSIDEKMLDRISGKTNGMKNKITDFLQEIKDFADKSNFESFFSFHREYYINVLRHNIKMCPKANFREIFTEYYGYPPQEMNVILSLTSGGVGFNLSCNDCSYSILGTFAMQDGIPVMIDKNHFIKMVLHEFSHGFINPLLNNVLINKDSIDRIYHLLKKDYREQYGNGNGMLSEQLVRASAARMMSLFFDKEKGRQMIEFDMSESFAAVELLSISLENNYEKNRATFPTIREFIPKVMDVIEMIK